MINPNRIHRIRNATIIELGSHGSIKCKSKGTTFSGWIDKPNRFSMGDKVNLQVQFSICLDGYTIKTANKPRVQS